MKYKIGDCVKYIMTGESCKVIATKEIPHKRENAWDVYPEEGRDYVLMPMRTLKEGG